MKLREKLEAVQHEIWSHWMEYLFSVCLENQNGSYTIQANKAERWKRQIQSHYKISLQ